MMQKAIEPTTEALLEEVCNEENQVTEILEQFNNCYKKITVKIRGKLAQ